jgi:hypothetical protein
MPPSGWLAIDLSSHVKTKIMVYFTEVEYQLYNNAALGVVAHLSLLICDD